ncbi:hypothetical protein MBLNU230_g1242t1 [Neophaeotheca triangularis]
MPTQTIQVPHLGGTTASYATPNNETPDPSKPTLVLVNSFTTDSDLYGAQFANKDLTSKLNLLAIELLGHGQTRTKSENFTYWDTAIMNLQVLEALGLGKRGEGKIFVLGTSQGGWVTVRMAVLAPEIVAGIIPLGTSMDAETPRTRSLSCWDAPTLLTPNIQSWTTASATPDFAPSTDYANFLIDTGFGPSCPQPTRDFWVRKIRSNYAGDSGRRRIRMAAINLRDRDGLHARCWDVQCPVLWLHGTQDRVYSVANAKEEIGLFAQAPEREVRVVEGGEHFLSFSHPDEVEGAVLEFVAKWA